MLRTRRYRFNVVWADSSDAAIQNAAAQAASSFAEENFCWINEVRVLDARYDEAAGWCDVTVEGPVYAEAQRQVEIPEPLASLMEACRVDCIWGNGLGAFEIDPTHIREWARDRPSGDLTIARSQRAALCQRLSPLLEEHFSRRLGFNGTGEEWARMLGRWKSAIDEATGHT